MPEQPAGRSYGVVWKLFGEDPHESCYVVEFVGKSHVSLLGYVSVSGEVYKVDRPVNEVWSGKDKLDFLLRILKRIAARIPLETCSPGWNACAPYCNRALCT